MGYLLCSCLDADSSFQLKLHRVPVFRRQDECWLGPLILQLQNLLKVNPMFTMKLHNTPMKCKVALPVSLAPSYFAFKASSVKSCVTEGNPPPTFMVDWPELPPSAMIFWRRN